MSHIDDTIQDLKNETARTRRKGYSHASVGLLELDTLLAWAEKVRENNPFLIGDRVKLPVSDDPEDGEQPETGVVIGFAGGGGLLIRPETGEYSDTKTGLWYEGTAVERIDD